MFSVARLGDSTSHGGIISSGSVKVLTDGLFTAKIGSLVTCPIHGPNSIVTGSVKVLVDGVGVAFIGSLTSCGSTIITGSSKIKAV